MRVRFEWINVFVNHQNVPRCCVMIIHGTGLEVHGLPKNGERYRRLNREVKTLTAMRFNGVTQTQAKSLLITSAWQHRHYPRRPP